MKKLSLIPALAMLLFVGCNREKAENIEIEQDIILVDMYRNYAWGYDVHGSFFDKNGAEYEFDFSEMQMDMTDAEMIAEMEKILADFDGVPEHSLYGKDMRYMYSLLCRVDKAKGFSEKDYAMDAGQRTLCGVRYNADGSGELIKIYSEGDVIQKPKDRNAKKLYKYYKAHI